MFFTLLNRVRGGAIKGSTPVIGLVFGFIIAMVFNNPYVGFAVACGYIIGESFGWGEWIGTLSVYKYNIKSDLYTMEEGTSNGVAHITRVIISPIADWVNYCRVALTIRGVYWWLPTLSPLYFVGVSWYLITLMVTLLSLSFPLACELGYRTQKYISIDFLNIKGGWNVQELWYGVLQDIIIIGGITWHFLYYQ